MFDIDLFKNINDEYGHLTGDFILKELAQIVARRIRKEEIFARYGGEEFAIVLPECKEVAAVEFAESIRSIVELHSFDFENNIIPVTISLGVGHIREAMAEPSDLLKAADQNLYKAKRAGRNQVCG